MKDIKLIEQINKITDDKIKEIILTNNGYLSQGYKIIGEKNCYFARRIIPGMSGFEYPMDSKKCFVISDLMIKNAGISKSYGVLDIDGEIYQITDFFEGKFLDIKEIDNEILDKICNQIASIHKNGKRIVSEFDDKKKSMLYKRSFREIITNNECLFMFFENFVIGDKDEKFFELLIKKMLDTYFEYVRNVDINRLTCLHGDFWNNNILIDQDKNINLIDFSRIPYGEPGIDIGRFLGQFVMLEKIGEIQNSEHIKKRFLEKYINLTGDKNIEKYIKLSILWVFYVSLSPMAQQFLKRNENKIKTLKEFAINY